MGSLTTFPLVRYRLDLTVTQDIRLPEYAGSALRGAFGHALKQLACVTRAPNCEGCMLVRDCAYPTVFAPQKPPATLKLPTPPVAYLIEPPTWGSRHYRVGENLQFHFTLFGSGISHLSIVLMAWMRAFSRGVGAGDGTAQLCEVSLANSLDGSSLQSIFLANQSIQQHSQTINLPDTPAPALVILEFITPLRLQENGHALPPSKITPRAIIMALHRRASLIHETAIGLPLYDAASFTELAHQSNSVTLTQHLTWRDWTRHSSRQRSQMTLGGCIGTITLQGDLTPHWRVLQLGQWLHLGKETVFGLGNYRLHFTN